MSHLFEELDYSPTPIGAISLRRRHDLALGVDVYEIKLGDDFLMTSLFTASEIALARAGVAACRGGEVSVVVGGLGLGYTAQAALAFKEVSDLIVIEYLAPVIAWHEAGVTPLGTALPDDPRCRLVQGDFFALASSETGFDPARPGRRFDAILADIDHTPDQLLSDRARAFYEPQGLLALTRHLKPRGVFGLWSNEKTDARFLERLRQVFAESWAEPVSFANPTTGESFTQTVYLARTGPA